MISNNYLDFFVVIQITMEIQKFLNGIVTIGDEVKYKNFVSNSLNNDYDAWGL